MASPSPRSIVLVPFPFTDFSQTKVRPALMLAHAGRTDWVLCQITSNPYGDADAISIGDGDFESGSLCSHSFVRPSKLFTMSEQTMLGAAGILNRGAFGGILDKLMLILNRSR